MGESSPFGGQNPFVFYISFGVLKGNRRRVDDCVVCGERGNGRGGIGCVVTYLYRVCNAFPPNTYPPPGRLARQYASPAEKTIIIKKRNHHHHQRQQQRQQQQQQQQQIGEKLSTTTQRRAPASFSVRTTPTSRLRAVVLGTMMVYECGSPASGSRDAAPLASPPPSRIVHVSLVPSFLTVWS